MGESGTGDCDQAIQALRIDGELGFPEARLRAIWNNRRWRDKATEWCETGLGEETFNISRFEWMIRQRVDTVSSHARTHAREKGGTATDAEDDGSTGST